MQLIAAGDCKLAVDREGGIDGALPPGWLLAGLGAGQHLLLSLLAAVLV